MHELKFSGIFFVTTIYIVVVNYAYALLHLCFYLMSLNFLYNFCQLRSGMREGSCIYLDGHPKDLFAQYWGELWPDSPTYTRFPNCLYTAELCT